MGALISKCKQVDEHPVAQKIEQVADVLDDHKEEIIGAMEYFGASKQVVDGANVAFNAIEVAKDVKDAIVK